MAEGLVGGVLGEEDDKPEVEAQGALAGAEAFAAAVAAIASRQDPQVARDTSTFLSKQSRLLDIQAQHLEDEHALRMTQLGHQAHLLRGQRLGQAIRIAFQIVIALIAIVIGSGIAVMLHDAFTSRGVVVEPFETPPALAARGLTGTVVAGAVLDELTRLQHDTHPTNAAKRTLSSAWAHEIKLAVPETGVSLGEITTLLKARFGQEVHVEGNVVELDRDKMALTIYGDGIARKTFTGAATEMDRLESQASDYIYAESQPRLWAIYLAEHDRLEELLAFIQTWYPTVDPADRPNLLLLLGLATARLNPTDDNRREDERDLRAALNLDPSYWVAYGNLVREQIQEGDEERAWQTGIELGQAADGTPGRASDRFFEPWYTLVRDVPGLLRADALEAANTGNRGLTSDFRPRMAMNLVAAHDLAAAELEL